MGFIRAGDLKVVSGPCWTPLQAVSLVAARGVRDLEKMSGCRRKDRQASCVASRGCSANAEMWVDVASCALGRDQPREARSCGLTFRSGACLAGQ